MKVRTTIAPHEVLDVDEAEYLDLSRQGLLLPDPADEQRATAQTAVDKPVTSKKKED